MRFLCACVNFSIRIAIYQYEYPLSHESKNKAHSHTQTLTHVAVHSPRCSFCIVFFPVPAPAPLTQAPLEVIDFKRSASEGHFAPRQRARLKIRSFWFLVRILHSAPPPFHLQAIYAVGDCCTKFQFTHAADFMARIVIRNALFFGELTRKTYPAWHLRGSRFSCRLS